MILDTEARTVEARGVISSAAYGFSEGDESHIFSILRDKLYSNKVLAVIREYSTNALDAHVLVGRSDLPVYVRVPAADGEPNFIVRDYGPGLAEDDVYRIYVKYGRAPSATATKPLDSWAWDARAPSPMLTASLSLAGLAGSSPSTKPSSTSPTSEQSLSSRKSPATSPQV